MADEFLQFLITIPLILIFWGLTKIKSRLKKTLALDKGQRP
jgi:hypothetical protein